ncbi:MAG: F0F1 ATP synthase subunit B family protein [Acidobacteriaceae bacterium]
MIYSAVATRSRAKCLSGFDILMLTVCGLFFLSLTVPSAHAVLADPIAHSSASAQNSTTVGQTKGQAERREEIRQRKIDNPEADDEANVYRHSATVQKLAQMFGMSVEAMSRWLELLNFLVVLGFIVWFLGRVMPKTLRDRTERIQRQLQQARTVTEDANRRLTSVEERLSRLDTEINGIKTQAQQEAVEQEKQMRATLEQEKQSILDSSAQEIAAASSKAQSQLKRMTAEMAIERAKHKIAVTVEADRSLVESFLVDLDRERRSGGVN